MPLRDYQIKFFEELKSISVITVPVGAGKAKTVSHRIPKNQLESRLESRGNRNAKKS